MTQVPSLGATASPPAIVGTETLAMVMSSTTMKLPTASRKAANQSAPPCIVAGWAGWAASAAWAAAMPSVRLLGDVDVDVHREADPQGVRGKLLGIELDAHRQALDDLDPVAGGVLGRDGGERRAGAAGEAHDRAVELHGPAVEVAGQHHALAEPHPPQLAFLEIGVDIGGLDRHHGHQLGAGLDPLADLGGVLGDDAVDRGADHGAR